MKDVVTSKVLHFCPDESEDDDGEVKSSLMLWKGIALALFLFNVR